MPLVKRLWAYIKEKKLQDPENKQYFTPDKKMIPIFGKEKVRAFGMVKHLKGHLTA
jgi:upstream activation factor subunit UAF30